MSNAAIFLHPEGYTTSGPMLMGRHSAGESFLRGFLRHGDVERFQFWNAAGRAHPELDALVNRIHPPTRPVDWISRFDRAALGTVGVVNLPLPDLNIEAWARRPWGQDRYAICGVTHTTATAHVQDTLADLLISPTEAHDALICTSSAVRGSVETQLEAVREYLKSEFGPRRRPEFQRVTIPLGVNAADFAPNPADRVRWRQQLGAGDDDIVVLYVGRFNLYGKMNPLLMALALEEAAGRTSRRIHWVHSGWADSEATATQYHAGARRLCPNVTYHVVDGRPADTRFSIWAAGDVFLSFSDNIQETFGLTPIEAMAAGLPCVVTDWDGYKDTVRDGVDGFRIPITMPRAGQGEDLAYRFANRTLNYDTYIGFAAQLTAIDYEAAVKALLDLFENPDLRRRMGAAGRQRAKETFDWSAIIPQYQSLWAEQDARRRAYQPATSAPVQNPWRLDPFALFSGYPTASLQSTDRLTVAPGFDWTAAQARMVEPLANHIFINFPGYPLIEQVFRQIESTPSSAVLEIVSSVPAPQRFSIERTLLWLARIGILRIVSGN